MLKKLLIMNYYFAYQIPKSVQITAISDRPDIQRALFLKLLVKQLFIFP
jgi:hypothetical protein